MATQECPNLTLPQKQTKDNISITPYNRTQDTNSKKTVVSFMG